MSSCNNEHNQLFARIRLHGLTKSSNGNACPIDLERRLSFPMPVDYAIAEEDAMAFGYTIDSDRCPQDLSVVSLAPRYDIEARVCFDRPIAQDVSGHPPDDLDPEGAIGTGRAGIVYPLEILSAKRANSQVLDIDRPLPSDGSAPINEEPPELPTLPPLYIKFAAPRYARNLAREAWFYEQFDKTGLTGLVTPRCYGVFHTPRIPDDLTIDIPGYDYYENASKPLRGISGLYTACLPEDYYDDETNTLKFNATRFVDDRNNSYTNSEWRAFREGPAVTTMTVLVMDMLGARITIEEFEKDWEGELEQIFDHFVSLDFLHGDVRFPNVLRVPPHLQVQCPMHPDANPGHHWNIVDWELGRILYTSEANPAVCWTQRNALCSDHQRVGGKRRFERKSFRKDFLAK